MMARTRLSFLPFWIFFIFHREGWEAVLWLFECFHLEMLWIHKKCFSFFFAFNVIIFSLQLFPCRMSVISLFSLFGWSHQWHHILGVRDELFSLIFPGSVLQQHSSLKWINNKYKCVDVDVRAYNVNCNEVEIFRCSLLWLRQADSLSVFSQD